MAVVFQYALLPAAMLVLVSAATQHCDIGSEGDHECPTMIQQDPVMSQMLLQKTNMKDSEAEAIETSDLGARTDGIRLTDGDGKEITPTKGYIINRMVKSDGGKSKCEDDLVMRSKCEKYAAELGFKPKFFKTRFFRNTVKWPFGCFIIKNRLFYNRNTKSTANCGVVPAVNCICAHNPHGHTAYAVKDKKCPSADIPKDKEECQLMADELHLPYTSRDFMRGDKNYPPGCFLIKKVLWWNPPSAKTTADCTGIQECVCKHPIR